jgi:hypothetical protein
MNNLDYSEKCLMCPSYKLNYAIENRHNELPRKYYICLDYGLRWFYYLRPPDV